MKVLRALYKDHVLIIVVDPTTGKRSYQAIPIACAVRVGAKSFDAIKKQVDALNPA